MTSTVEHVRVSRLLMPVGRPFTFRFGAVAQRSYTVCEVFASTGTKGIAYSLDRVVSSAPTTAFLVQQVIGSAVESLSADLSGGALFRARTEVDQFTTAKPRAVLELALVDLIARERECTVAEVIGVGTRADDAPIPAIAVIGYCFDDDDSFASEVDRAVAAGYQCIKVPLGDRPEDVDGRQLAEALEKYSDLEIAIDAHFNYDSPEDLDGLRDVLDHPRIVWIEDLYPHGSLASASQAGARFAIGDDAARLETVLDAVARGNTVRPDPTVLGVAGWRAVTEAAAARPAPVCNHVHPRVTVPLFRGCRTRHPAGLEHFMDPQWVDPIEMVLWGGAHVERGNWVLADEPGFGFDLPDAVRTRFAVPFDVTR